jgi:hypothetical protein
MKAEKNYISAWCVIRNGIAISNGQSLVEGAPAERGLFLKELYKLLKCDYPKFYKMDDLSKLAFIASEVLLKDRKLNYAPGEIALVFSNSSASLDTDIHYFNSVEVKSNYFPSPAVFVYTLPNIMVGEICIRNKFSGENAFFVSEKFEPGLLSEYAVDLITAGKSKCVIAGWVEINEMNWEAVLFLIEGENSNGAELSEGNLVDIYNLTM